MILLISCAEMRRSPRTSGNFIIFAYQAVISHDHYAFVKLVSFPVFVLAVITGGWLAEKAGKPYYILLAEGSILIISGLVSLFFGSQQLVTYTAVMLTVFAMGFQNAFGRLFPKNIYGVTTMMTGNVTQAALDLDTLLRGDAPRLPTLTNLGKDLILIFGFLAGCFLGGWASTSGGLVTLYAPGLAILAGAAFSKKLHSEVIPKNHLITIKSI